MADFCDDASRRTETLMRTYLGYRKHSGPKATGNCLCCGAPLPGQRWCDADCREMYLREWRNLTPRDVPPAEREEIVVFGDAAEAGESAI